MEAPSVSDLRKDYALAELVEATADPCPIRQFGAWLAQALGAELPEPYAMTLATVSSAGHPSARMVLLRSVDERGFVFYTNYHSRKGRELHANAHAALVFYWPELERQVRVEGRVGLVEAAESDAYFASRPRLSRLGAWASEQSEVIPDRSVLEERMAALQEQYPGETVPRPPDWGGFRVLPAVIEFWQGRRSRLHDRLVYQRQDDGWRRFRLSP